MKWLRKNLQARLLVVGSLPLLLVTALLTTSNIHNRQTDITATVNQSGRRITDHLSRTVDFALYTNNRTLLASMANSLDQIPNILGVAFLDNERRLLVPSASFPNVKTIDLSQPLPKNMQEYGHFLLFESPVYNMALDIEDYPGSAETFTAKETLGWVVVAMDLTSVHEQQRAIIFTSIGIAAGALGTAVLLALALSRSVIIPIRKLSATVSTLEQGDLSARALVSSADEFAILANGINHLAESVTRSQTDLEQKIQVATLGLTQALQDLRIKNTELQQATRDAEAADRAKSDFLARMSHELRTPLTSIQGFVRLLEQSSLEASDKHYCHIIDSASNQLLTMINDILEFTKLQSGTQTVTEEAYTVFDCIEQPIQLLAPSAHNKGLELYCDFAPDVPDRLIGDAVRIRQLVTNLVGNAIKFTEQGYVSVQISIQAPVKPEDSRHGSLVITVSDTGIGMNSTQQNRVFEAFAQADASISRQFGGTGLGLAIIRAYTDLMGGTIHLDSQPEKGTVFQVLIPLTQQTPKSQSADIPGPVLLYDTDPQSRNASRHLLERMVKTELVEAADFDQLIDALADITPSAVVVNWSLNEAKPQQMAALEHIVDSLNCPVVVQAPLQVIREQLPQSLMNNYPAATFIAKPAQLAELKTALLKVNLASNEDSGSNGLAGIRILVAEDNEFSRLLLCTLLERAGCQYQEARNGREALMACRQQPYDLLLLDLHMPEVSGIEVLRDIRQTDNPNRNTPVIVLTADTLTDVQEELGPLQVQSVINKPFDEKKLLQDLFDLTGRTGSLSPQVLERSGRPPRQRYFTEIYHLLDGIAEALGAQNIKTARELCHQLAGIAAVYPQGDLDKQTKRLHSLLQTEDIEQAGGVLNSIRLETTQLEQSDDDEPSTSLSQPA